MFRITVWNHITPTILCAYIVFTSSVILGLVRTPAGIVGKHGTVFIAELRKPFKTWCLTYGEPLPEVAWFRVKNGMKLVARGNLLHLHISYETVGDYVCQANNSAHHVAMWLVIIKAYETQNVVTEYNPHILLRLRIENLKDMESTAWRIVSSGPVRTSAGIVGKQGTVLIAELGKPFETWCLTYGDPPPEVAWFRVKSNGMEFVAKGNILQLNTSYHMVGDYVCRANNSADHVATWLVIIKAYQTEDVETDNPHILPRLRIKNLRDVESRSHITDNPAFANCLLIVRSKYCQHKYYARFCSKSCLEAGELSAHEVTTQADQPLVRNH